MIKEVGGFSIKGKVLKPSKGNLFLVTSDKLPPLGSYAFLKDGTKVGSLRDVIGKVEKPLLVISVGEGFRHKLKPGTTIILSAPYKVKSKKRIRR